MLPVPRQVGERVGTREVPFDDDHAAAGQRLQLGVAAAAREVVHQRDRMAVVE